MKLKELLWITESNTNVNLYVSEGPHWTGDEKLLKTETCRTLIDVTKAYYECQVIGVTVDENNVLHICVYKGEE